MKTHNPKATMHLSALLLAVSLLSGCSGSPSVLDDSGVTLPTEPPKRTYSTEAIAINNKAVTLMPSDRSEVISQERSFQYPGGQPREHFREQSKMTTDGNTTNIKWLPGPSNFFRCPACGAYMQKSGFIEFLQGAMGSLKCGGCSKPLSVSSITSGKLDVQEVELDCPSCSTHLCGPADDLLGHPCPSCEKQLPQADKPGSSLTSDERIVKCPGCAKRLRVKTHDLENKVAKCPGCGQRIYIPHRNVQQASPQDQWWVRMAQGNDFGPVTKAELDQWVAERRVTENSQLRRGDWRSWRAATDLYRELSSTQKSAEQTEMQWHLQTADGQQFGPVTREVLDKWFTENRINAQCQVWQQGWKESKPATAIYPSLASARKAAKDSDEDNIFGFLNELQVAHCKSSVEVSGGVSLPCGACGKPSGCWTNAAYGLHHLVECVKNLDTAGDEVTSGYDDELRTLREATDYAEEVLGSANPYICAARDSHYRAQGSLDTKRLEVVRKKMAIDETFGTFGAICIECRIIYCQACAQGELGKRCVECRVPPKRWS